MPLLFVDSTETPFTTADKVVGVTFAPTLDDGVTPAPVQEGSVRSEIVSGDGTLGAQDGNSIPELLTGELAADTVVLVTMDADLGDGVSTISDTITLRPALKPQPMAKNVGLGGGSVVPK